jgi:hypothetical protein
MRTTLFAAALAASCIALASCTSLGAGAGSGASPDAIVKAIEALNDGCDKTVDINLSYVPPMPPAGNVKIQKTCLANKRTGGKASADPIGDALATAPVKP